MAMIDSNLRLGFGETERKGKISGSGLNWKIIALLLFLFPDCSLAEIIVMLDLCWIFAVLKLQQ